MTVPLPLTPIVPRGLPPGPAVPRGLPSGVPPMSAAPTLVVVAHGSRDPAALRSVRALLASVRAARPGTRAVLGHVELDEPLLADVLAGLPAGGRVVLVPLLFGRGHHVKHDLPAALAGAPHLRGTVAAPLGPHPLLTEALHGRLTESLPPEGRADVRTDVGTDAGSGAHPGAGARAGAGVHPGADARPGPFPGAFPRVRPDAVILASAGSRDPDSAAGTRRIAADLRARLGGTPVVPAYASAAAPTVAEAARALRAAGHRRIALASCFAAPGRFASQCAAEAPWTASQPLGPHPALSRLVLHRYDEARAPGTSEARASATAAAAYRSLSRRGDNARSTAAS